MITREQVLEEIKHRPILIEGHRNDDAVNMAIVAYADHEGKLSTGSELYIAIDELVNKEDLMTSALMDLDYLKDKCEVLIGYLPGWYNTGDIYGYAIV